MLKRWMFMGALVAVVLAAGGIGWALMASGGPAPSPAALIPAAGPGDDGSTTTSAGDGNSTTTNGAEEGTTSATSKPEDDGTTTTTEPEDDGTTGTTEPDEDGTTTTTEPAAPLTDPFTETYAVNGAGTVTISFDGIALALLEVNAAEGWDFEIDHAAGDEVEVEFRMGTTEARFEAEVDDGEVVVEIGTHEDEGDDESDDRDDDSDESEDDESGEHGSEDDGDDGS